MGLLALPHTNNDVYMGYRNTKCPSVCLSVCPDWKVFTQLLVIKFKYYHHNHSIDKPQGGLDLIWIWVTSPRSQSPVFLYFVCITSYQIEIRSPYSKHRCTTWWERSNVHMNDLDPISKVRETMYCANIFRYRYSLQPCQSPVYWEQTTNQVDQISEKVK